MRVWVALPISVLLGANHVQFGYTGSKQGLKDEGWGINLATITRRSLPKTAVPEPSTLVLFIMGILGIVALRRKLV